MSSLSSTGIAKQNKFPEKFSLVLLTLLLCAYFINTREVTSKKDQPENAESRANSLPFIVLVGYIPGL